MVLQIMKSRGPESPDIAGPPVLEQFTYIHTQAPYPQRTHNKVKRQQQTALQKESFCDGSPQQKRSTILKSAFVQLAGVSNSLMRSCHCFHCKKIRELLYMFEQAVVTQKAKKSNVLCIDPSMLHPSLQISGFLRACIMWAIPRLFYLIQMERKPISTKRQAPALHSVTALLSEIFPQERWQILDAVQASRLQHTDPVYGVQSAGKSSCPTGMRRTWHWPEHSQALLQHLAVSEHRAAYLIVLMTRWSLPGWRSVCYPGKDWKGEGMAVEVGPRERGLVSGILQDHDRQL